MGFKSWLANKLNPAQSVMASAETSKTTSNTKPYTTRKAYRDVELVNRSINLLVDSASQVNYEVDDALKFTSIAAARAPGGVRKTKLQELLNVRPNPYMDISTFRRLLFMDFFMEGWAFIHWDGQSLYHIPAAGMEVVADTKTYVNKYVYDGRIEYSPDEIILIRDNYYEVGGTLGMSGQSRILSCLSSVTSRSNLLTFKENFFKNGAIFSIVVETDAVLSKKIKKRFTDEVTLDYNPRTGKSSALVLDAGMKAKSLTPTSTKDLEVSADIADFEKNIMVALGIPPLLLDSGNNANIRPNIELFYYMTILPCTKKFQAALELFFGYELSMSTTEIAALTPDREKEATAVSAKVNNGIITPQEGRIELRYEKLDDPKMEEIRIPANIAGSATGVANEEGGRPSDED